MCVCRVVKLLVLMLVLMLMLMLCCLSLRGLAVDQLQWRREISCACLDGCVSSSQDQWFTQRFHTDAPTLLSRNNSLLNTSTYSWWQSLQSSKSAVNYSVVIDQLFAVIPADGHYTDGGASRCRTCAVVGNSGNLLGSFYGPLIDQHDLVIRMNKAPVEGFQKDVGSRTTHRIMYPESAVHLDASTHLVLMPFKMLDLQWLTSALTNGSIKRTRFKVIDKLQADRSKAMVVHPAFIHYVQRSWLRTKGRRSYPSTGFLTLMWALHVCDQVSVFGFGADAKGLWNHYFEKMPKFFRGTGRHSGGEERQVIQQLQRRSLITLYTGW